MSKICLIGSTKFKEEFEFWNKKFSLDGNIVYSVACFGHSGDTLTETDKFTLDAVHLAKIMESDEVFCINKNGYIGESTRRELHLALVLDKIIRFLEGDIEAQRFMKASLLQRNRPEAQ